MDDRAKTRLRNIESAWAGLTKEYADATDIKLSDCTEPFESLNKVKAIGKDIQVLVDCYMDLVRYPEIMTAQEFVAKLYYHNGSAVGNNGKLILLFDYNWSAVNEIGLHDPHSLSLSHGSPVRSGIILSQAERAIKQIDDHTAFSGYAPLWVEGCKPRRAVTNVAFNSEQDKLYFTVITKETK